MRILLIIGIIIALAYTLTMCYVVVCEILDAKHPSESAVTRAFIKVASCYFVVSLIYIIGHYVGGAL